MSRRRSTFRVTSEEATFLDAAIQASVPTVRKQALQRLCGLYRRGGRLTAPRSMKALVLQALTDTDLKVRRWAFNVLAQLGERADVQLMVMPWRDNRSNGDVFEAGLTALAGILPKDELLPLLSSEQVDLDPLTVMALGQQTGSFADELAKLRLNVERATVAELRAATLLIGLTKAPNTLFSGRFPVSDVIGDLNTHDDPIVAQYSFWATVEHPSLGLANVRVATSSFSTLPPNVQGWAYRTLTKDGTVAVDHYDVIVEASSSEHLEVREGVATGLRDVYYDSLDTMVADWFLDEQDPVTKDRLLEHMAAHSGKSSFYREEVLAAYRTAGLRSITRSRLEAANRDADVSLAMRKIALQTGDPDLFASMVGLVTNNTQNFSGPMNVAGISNSGTGNTGSVQIISAIEAQTRATPILAELKAGLASSSNPEIVTIARAVDEASDAPTKGKVARVLALLKELKDGGETVAGLGELITKGYGQLAPLLEYLPDMM